MLMNMLSVTSRAMAMMTTRPDAPEQLRDRLAAALPKRRDRVVAVVHGQLDPVGREPDEPVGQPGEQPDDDDPDGRAGSPPRHRTGRSGRGVDRMSSRVASTVNWSACMGPT